MTVKINGKDFDFDSDDLYEGEGEEKRNKFWNDVKLLVCFLSWGFIAYPLLYKGMKAFFAVFLGHLGIYL
jgi:hypothetical protein